MPASPRRPPAEAQRGAAEASSPATTPPSGAEPLPVDALSAEPLSARNPRVARLRRLVASRRERRQARRYVIEGPRSLAEALRSSRRGPDLVEEVLVEGAAATALPELAAGLRAAGVPVRRVADGVLARVGDVRTSQGWAAVGVMPDLRPPTTLARCPLVLVLVDVADPGNVGTLLRAADAAAAAAVLLTPHCADPFSPKVVRAAAGALFRLTLVEADDPLAVLGRWQLPGLGCAATGGTSIDEVDLSGPVALVLGSEAHGLPAALSATLPGRVSIPMPGPAESLNVAMAGTVVLFEALRQRRAVARGGDDGGSGRPAGA